MGLTPFHFLFFGTDPFSFLPSLQQTMEVFSKIEKDYCQRRLSGITMNTWCRPPVEMAQDLCES